MKANSVYLLASKPEIMKKVILLLSLLALVGCREQKLVQVRVINKHLYGGWTGSSVLVEDTTTHERFFIDGYYGNEGDTFSIRR